MDLAAAHEITLELLQLGGELGLWAQKCRWAGLNNLEFSRDFLVNIDLCREFSFPQNSDPFVLLGMTITIKNPPASRQFVLIFAFVDLTSPIGDSRSYPESTTFMPSIAQGHWALRLASLDPMFVGALLHDTETTAILKDNDFFLNYVPTTSTPLPKFNIKDLKVLGGGDTTNSIVRVTLDTPIGLQRVVFKSYLRLLEHNIEAEVISQLHAVGFSAVPALEGSLTLVWGGRSYTLLMVSQFVENDGDGGKPFWDHLQEYLRASRSQNNLTPILQRINPLAQLIGRTTREFHEALSKSKEQSFLPEKVDISDVAAWSGEFRENFANMARICSHRLPQLFLQLLPATSDLIMKLLSFLQRYVKKYPLVDSSFVPIKQRIHGDLHLGQFLFQSGDPAPRFIVTDLEGDPQLPPERRREKRTVWFDLGGLLRALDYIAFFGVWEILKQLIPSYQWSAEDIFACFFERLTARPVPKPLEQHRNQWEPTVENATKWVEIVGSQILQGYFPKESLPEKLPFAFKFLRATSELNYELGFRGQNALVPLLGVLTTGRMWVGKKMP